MYAETEAIPITRMDAERLAPKETPRITADRVLVLGDRQVPRETQSGKLPQVPTAMTAERTEDWSRVGALPSTIHASTFTP